MTLTAGTGALTQWPAYAAKTARFAVVPSSAANDSLVVTASTSDPKGKVLVDGRPVRSGRPTTVTGLAPGDEVSVIIDDARGHSAQSWIYLPSTFPQLSTKGTLDEGKKHVFLTLSNFLTATPYETVVDQNAVPSWFEQDNGSDLKPVDLGRTRYSLARHDGGGGYRIDELDRRFHTIRSHQLDDVPASTDFHDSELLPDGRSLLLGYDGDSRAWARYLDAVIQIVGRDGAADFTWNSKDHVDPAEAYVDGGTGDYAHINSLQYLPKSGDILASFRNLSQVMLIAGPDDPDHPAGTVIWRLGGEQNDFTFLDDPDGGNCAQHMARILPNGHLMLFDNGSRADPTGPIGAQSGNMCPDPAHPGGARIARPSDQDHRVPAEHQRPGSSASQARVELRAAQPLRSVCRQPAAVGRRPDLRRLVPGQPGRRHPRAGAGGEPGLARAVRRNAGGSSAAAGSATAPPSAPHPTPSARRSPSPRRSKARSSRRATRCGCASGAPTPVAPASTRAAEPSPTVTGSRRRTPGTTRSPSRPGTAPATGNGTPSRTASGSEPAGHGYAGMTIQW